MSIELRFELIQQQRRDFTRELSDILKQMMLVLVVKRG